MKQVPLLLLIGVSVAGCAMPTLSRTDKPTSYFLLREQKRPVTHVEVFVEESPDKVIRNVQDASKLCLDRDSASSWMMPAGPMIVGGTLRTSRSVEVIEQGDTLWVALRTRGDFHMVPIAFEIAQNGESGSKLVVYRADMKKKEAILALVASGELFCRFKEISYPFD